MDTITRLNVEAMIKAKLELGETGLNDAIKLATLEFEYPEDVNPHLEEAFYMAQNTDEVLIKWSDILSDFAKVA